MVLFGPFCGINQVLKRVSHLVNLVYTLWDPKKKYLEPIREVLTPQKVFFFFLFLGQFTSKSSFSLIKVDFTELTVKSTLGLAPHPNSDTTYSDQTSVTFQHGKGHQVSRNSMKKYFFGKFSTIYGSFLQI